MLIGGRGFYGTRVSEVLDSLEGIETTVVSRSSGFDLSDPTTFWMMDSFNLVLNCSDTLSAPPDLAAAYAAKQGMTFFDMGADSATAERLLGTPPGKGRVVVGVGIFPGLSTSMARHLSDEVAGCETLEFAVRISPFSGAGKGNCRLATQTLLSPTIHYKGGQRVEGTPVGEARPFNFLGDAEAEAIECSLPDGPLIHKSTGVPNISTYMATKPGILRFVFKISALAMAIPLIGKFFIWQTYLSMLFMRALIFRQTNTSVQLTILVDRNLENQRSLSIRCPDGISSTALGVGSAVSLWLSGEAMVPPGVHAAGEVFKFEELVREFRRLGGTLIVRG